nr:MAG TPA: nonstructural protein [Caudoviricetes sp.]
MKFHSFSPFGSIRFVEVIIAKSIGWFLTKNAIPVIADYSTDSE